MAEQLENNPALEVSEETNLPLSEEVTTESEDHMMFSEKVQQVHVEDECISSESGASELLPETLVLPIQETHIDVPAASRCPPEMSVGNPQERSSPTIVHEPQEESSPEASPPTAKRSKYSAEERGHGSFIQHNVIRGNVINNSTFNIYAPKLSDDHTYPQPYEMSCKSPVDRNRGCRFSATFQRAAYKILTILEESKQDEYVYFIALGLSGPNPRERIFKEIEECKYNSLREVFKHYTGNGRWNWMDFDSLNCLLVQAEKELDPDEHDEKECLSRALRELQKYRDKLWSHLDSRLMPLREDPPESDLAKSDPVYVMKVKDKRDKYNITPKFIIEWKEKLAKSLKIGLELFSVANIYKGCTTIWFEIHSEVTSENVKQALLRKGGTEECTEDGHSVVTYYFEDYHVEEVKIREHVTAVVTEKCKQHGARPMETSEIEYRRNLEGKYFSDAEESEIICDLVGDEGESERLALRPDLTIPFARYLAEKKQDNLKRYEVGKVYSRAKNGKETIQIDFDIAGQFDLMTSDAECLRLLSEVLTALHLNDFIIRVNHLSLQKGILMASGVSQEQLPAVLSCIRKFEDAHEDLVALGLPHNVAEKVVGYLKLKGDHKVVDELKRDEVLMMVDIVRESLTEIDQLLKYCAAFEIHDKVHIDLGLTRVYDYYTGVVFQASVIDGPLSEICLSRGGRYDDLVDKFCDGFKVPCVGFTFDLLTIADLMWRRQIKSEVLQTLPSEENAISDLHTVTEMDTTSEVLPVPAKVKAISRKVEVMTIEDDSQLNGEVEESMSCTSPLKNPKGMRDYNPHDMMLRSKIIKLITAVYKKHGAVTIDTPALELKEVLKGKYGEESKLIYDLENQGGETQSLRYDLTVPFARYLATNRKHYMKRYQIDKVYRRDKPSIRQGRCREMYQCDFDIAGDYDPMLPDAECIRIVSEILTLPELGLGDIVIKINHRKLLDGMFEACGVPGDKFRTICSAVDKLDKDSWENVRKEMLSKDLSPEVADQVYDYVSRCGKHKLLEELQKDPSLASVPTARQGLEELLLLLEYCKAYGVIDNVMVDLSLARGLDYYTGVIFETKLLKANEEEISFGSLCGGGRYDNLVASFDPKGQFKVPCVGFSIGLERIFNILENRNQKDSGHKIRTVETEVYVVTGQKDMLTDRMSLCAHLWDHGIKTEMSYKANPKMLTQFQYCEKEGIPFQVIIGEEEKEHGSVKIRDTVTKDEVLVKREVVAHHLKNALIKKGYTQPGRL